MSITEKGIITLHIEPDDEAQNDYNDCPKIDLPITVTELKNLSESKRVFQDKWHVEYVSSKYPEIERRLICQPNYTAVNVLAYKLSLMDEDEIKEYLSILERINWFGNIDDSVQMAMYRKETEKRQADRQRKGICPQEAETVSDRAGYAAREAGHRA